MLFIAILILKIILHLEIKKHTATLFYKTFNKVEISLGICARSTMMDRMTKPEGSGVIFVTEE